MAHGEEHDIEIRRRVALSTLVAARIAWKAADDSPTEDNLQTAFGACLLASRSLRRAADDKPDDEDVMLDKALLIDELALGLKTKLVRMLESAA